MSDAPLDPLIQPQVIPLHAAAADPIVLPDPATLFIDRAARFEQLAARGDPQQAFFTLMARLSRAQHEAARTVQPCAPDDALVRTRHRHRMPIVPAGLAEREGSSVDAVRAVLAAGAAIERAGAMPADVAIARRRLEAAGDDAIDASCRALLSYDYESLPPDAVPWIAAGVQVDWVVTVHALGRDAVRPLDVGGVCPCCGSLPVASLRRIGGLQQGLRYLVCSLCATQWHMVRIKCSHCESTAGIGYLTLTADPDSEAGKAAATREVVKAEVCDTCSSYLKLVSHDADPSADPVADDLATLALDVLTDARGYLRIGPNLFIHPGLAAA